MTLFQLGPIYISIISSVVTVKVDNRIECDNKLLHLWSSWTYLTEKTATMSTHCDSSKYTTYQQLHMKLWHGTKGIQYMLFLFVEKAAKLSYLKITFRFLIYLSIQYIYHLYIWPLCKWIDTTHHSALSFWITCCFTIFIVLLQAEYNITASV